MEQVMIFWAMHTNEILGAALLLVMVLLLVTLHRIKQIGIQLGKLADGFAAPADETADDTALADGVPQMQAVGMEDADTPEELLDAVLGEVFS